MEFKFDEKFRIKRFKGHYSDLFPANMDNSCKNFIKNHLQTPDLNKPILIIDSHDWMRQSFVGLFLRKGFVSYKLMSAYTLLDIYLGHSEDYQAISDVTADVLCFYLGYGEFENKRQSDVLIQVINNQTIDRKNVWIYFRGSTDSFKSKYGDLYKFFEQNSYTIVKPGSGIRRVGDEL